MSADPFQMCIPKRSRRVEPASDRSIKLERNKASTILAGESIAHTTEFGQIYSPMQMKHWPGAHASMRVMLDVGTLKTTLFPLLILPQAEMTIREIAATKSWSSSGIPEYSDDLWYLSAGSPVPWTRSLAIWRSSKMNGLFHRPPVPLWFRIILPCTAETQNTGTQAFWHIAAFLLLMIPRRLFQCDNPVSGRQ